MWPFIVRMSSFSLWCARAADVDDPASAVRPSPLRRRCQGNPVTFNSTAHCALISFLYIFFTPSCLGKQNVCLEAVLLWFCSPCHRWCTNCPFCKCIFSCHPSCLCLCLSHSVYWLTRSPFPLTSPGTASMTNCPCSRVICDAVYSSFRREKSSSHWI